MCSRSDVMLWLGGGRCLSRRRNGRKDEGKGNEKSETLSREASGGLVLRAANLSVVCPY